MITILKKFKSLIPEQKSCKIYFIFLFRNNNNVLCAQINLKANFCIEIIYYNSNNLNLPKIFNFIDNNNKTIKIDKYDNFGIPNVIRFSFINIEKKNN